MQVIKFTSTFCLLLIFTLLEPGCFTKPSLASPKYDRLPPIKSLKTPDEPDKNSVKKMKFPRRIYRLPQNDFDIKIIHSDRKKSGFFSKDLSQVGFAIHCSDINGDSIQDIIIGAPYPEGQNGFPDPGTPGQCYRLLQ